MQPDSMTPPLILASKSPRRRELLARAGIDFRILTVDVDETASGPPEARVACLARKKALAVAEGFSEGLVLGADTLVALSDQVLGKPEDESDAFYMLKSLSGRAHFVFTGLCLIDAETRQERSHVERTTVVFKELTDAQIRAYIQTGEPMDKAGAYAIQGGAAAFVKEYIGSYDNVVGLPVEPIMDWLANRGMGGNR